MEKEKHGNCCTTGRLCRDYHEDPFSQGLGSRAKAAAAGGFCQGKGVQYQAHPSTRECLYDSPEPAASGCR